MTMKFYKTVVTIEILHDETTPTILGLDHAAYEIFEGGSSGLIDIGRAEGLTREQLITECEKHGTDPDFFLGFEEENEEAA